jgi:sugar lactone lactonase YvrE
MRVLALLAAIVVIAVVALPLGIVAQGPPRGGPAAAPCVQAGNTQYVCAQVSPEDLVVVPGGEWVVSTAYAQPGGLRVINVRDKSTTIMYPSATAKEQFDNKTYDTCPGPPNEQMKAYMQTHGVAIKEGRNNQHTLYAVHHGTRESIEVFQMNASVRPPTLTWIGCVVAPDPIGLNEVLPLADGGFISTDFMARGIDQGARGRAMAGEALGALYEWHTGKGWAKISGSESSMPNGLEISKDGKTLYVATWGDQGFFRLSLGQNPPKRDNVKLGFRADNVRWSPDGQLFVTGQVLDPPAPATVIVKIHPDTLKVTEILRRPNTPEFSNGTVAVQVGRELWVGTFRGDRLLVVPAP